MYKCQKYFGQAGHLKIHMLTHSKEIVSNARDLEEAATVGKKYTTVKNAESSLAKLVF